MIQWNPGDPLTDSDRELLQPLIDRAVETGMTPTVKEIPTASKIKSRFRIWKNAVMAAGLQSLNSAEQTKLREEMYQRIRSTQEETGRKTDMTHADMIQTVLNEGFVAAAIIPMDKVVFDSAFRPYCEENLCGHYGANYSCPPDCGTPEAMEARMKAYQHALVFQTKWDITDYHDVQAIKAAKQSHNQGMMRVISKMNAAGYSGVMAGASSCTLCERCAILDGESCHDPERQFSCLSAYCIYVKKLAEECNMEYTCSDGKLAFFGLFAF